MQQSKKFVFDISITLIASMISMLLGLIITVLLGRYLGANDLGLYYMNSTIYGITLLFAGMGIPAAIIKKVAENKGDRIKSNRIVSSGIITSLCLGIAVSILFYFSAGIIETLFKMPGLSGLLKILAPVFPFSLVGGILLGLLNGRREMKKYGTATIVQGVLMTLISVFLIYKGLGVSGVVIGVLLSSVGWCLFLIWTSRMYFEIMLDNYVEISKELLLFGIQIVGANAINVINYQADTLMIGYFLTATDLGYYGVAAGLCKFFWIIPNVIQTITYPATSEYLGTKNQEALQIMIDRSMKYTAIILLPIGLGIGFFAEYLIIAIYGAEFNKAVPPMLILIAGTVIYGIVRSIGSSVTGAGRPDLELKVVGISATINIVLNGLLIPSHGIVGAAIATMISFLVNAFLGLFLIIRILNIKFDFEWFTRISGLSIISILLFYFFGVVDIYIIGITILIIYLLVLYVFLFPKEDMKFFKQLLP